MVTSDLGRVTTYYAAYIPSTIRIVVTSDLGRVTTSSYPISIFTSLIVVTSDLGRVTTNDILKNDTAIDCGDVRSRTSYNLKTLSMYTSSSIVVTSDLGRVTTLF